jgi:DNA-binding response OmpR family regulator
MKVLVVEAQHDSRHALAPRLKRRGLVVEEAHDAATALWAATQLSPDVVAVDFTTPGLAGLELLRQLRSHKVPAPIVVVAASGAVEDCLHGFDAGADDYLVKPFDVRELVARIQALGRRRTSPPCEPVVIGDVTLDTASGAVLRQGAKVAMRRRERLLLELLGTNLGRVVSRATIEAKLYSESAELLSNSVEAAVSQLRRQIDTPGQPSRIITLRGEGYRLER